MKQKAILSAKKRLRSASEAIDKMRAAGPIWQDSEAGWWAFVNAADSVFNRLRDGARGHSKSWPWFGTFTNLQKKDPLLLYIHQARNAEWHGLEESAEPYLVFIPAPGVRIDPDDPNHIISDKNVGAIGKFGPVHVILKPVTNKWGDTFDPPKSHLGQPIEDGSPLGVAELAFGFLENLIKDAEARVER